MAGVWPDARKRRIGGKNALPGRFRPRNQRRELPLFRQRRGGGRCYKNGTKNHYWLFHNCRRRPIKNGSDIINVYKLVNLCFRLAGGSPLSLGAIEWQPQQLLNRPKLQMPNIIIFQSVSFIQAEPDLEASRVWPML